MLKITPALKQWLVDEDHTVKSADDALCRRTVGRLLAEGTLSAEKFEELSEMKTATSPDPSKVFSRRDDDPNIRVKAPSEGYSEKRYEIKNKRGETVIDPIYGRECVSMSDAAKARHGVFLKHLANRSGLVNNPLTEHEKSLLDEVCNEQDWCGKVGSEHFDSITGHKNVKALLDDVTSGGVEITPIEFDSDVVTFPLLNGELFPMVDLKPIPRGRRVEGASIGTPSMTWGGADGSDISLFTTTSLVAPIDTTVFAIDGVVEIGRDFLSDTPVEVGETLTGLIGDRLATELDKVVANGNGSTQPEGLFQASGVGSDPLITAAQVL